MGSTCSSPPTPDYAAAAQAQGAANVDTARVEGSINRPDIYTPYGSQIWHQDPGNPDKYSMTQTLSPAEWDKLNYSNAAQIGGLQQLATYGPENIQRALSQNFSIGGQAATDFDPRFMPSQGMQTDSGFWAAPAQQEDVNLGSAPGIPTADAATRQAITDAVYRQGASYLDPQFQQQQDQMNSDLSNQGIFRDSNAYNTTQDNFARQREQAYGDLRDRAIQTGGEEMARDFGLGMQAHQAGVNDILSAGQFHNTARGDLINQLLADMQSRNAALTAQTNQGVQGTQLYNSGRLQALNEMSQQATIPINLQNAILTGSQVNNPQFQPFNNQIQVQPPPIMQAALAQGQAQQNQYNAGQGLLGNFLNAGANLGSAYLLRS